jgi:uncharacterized protein (DUF1501 family)
MIALTRRTALAHLAAAVAMVGPARISFGGTNRRLVVVYLKGALDGLHAVPALGDNHYRSARGGLALQRAINLDGFFGLHPALAPLHQFYAKGELILLPAVATGCREYSHASGQFFLEHGAARGDDAQSRWTDRALALNGWAAMPKDRCVLSNSTVDLIGDLCRGRSTLADAMADSSFSRNWNSALKVQVQAFRREAEKIGTVLAHGSGPSILILESYGWDTHADQGTHYGRLASMLAALADSLTALAAASVNVWRHTVVLVATEFGRSVAMNSTDGTNHGTASFAFLLGGAVAGGRVVGEWPGLAPDKLYRGRDLAPITDVRSVVKAILVHHLGLSKAAVESVVFPRSDGLQPMQGLFRA